MATANKPENLISDEEDMEDIPILIQSDSESSLEVQDLEPKHTRLTDQVILVPTNASTEIWWDKLQEDVPVVQRCKIVNCKFAPSGHRSHLPFRRSYSTVEIKQIIKYLIHYDDIHHGKGLKVWEEMHERGYMRHRTVQSLNNHFKKSLLRDITLYALPKDIEAKFLELRS